MMKAFTESEVKLPISIVIATLGGDVLYETLNVICNLNLKPTEIIVCLPGCAYESNESLKLDASIKMILTGQMGQVSQRAVGLACATQPYVLQMDDDITLYPNCLTLLFDSLQKLGPGNIVSANCCSLSGDYATKFPVGWRSFFPNLYQTIVYGAPWGDSKQGKLIKSGVGYWVDARCLNREPFLVEWVPGGCVLSFKEDLIFSSYYPFPGKAYAEDFIHSILWRNAGKKLWAIPCAYYATKIEPLKFSLKEMHSNFRAHKYTVKLINGSTQRLYVWYLIFVIKNSLLTFLRSLARQF